MRSAHHPRVGLRAAAVRLRGFSPDGGMNVVAGIARAELRADVVAIRTPERRDRGARTAWLRLIGGR